MTELLQDDVEEEEEEVTAIDESGPMDDMLIARVSSGLKEEVEKRCAAEGTDQASFLRDAVRLALSMPVRTAPSLPLSAR